MRDGDNDERMGVEVAWGEMGQGQRRAMERAMKKGWGKDWGWKYLFG